MWFTWNSLKLDEFAIGHCSPVARIMNFLFCFAWPFNCDHIFIEFLWTFFPRKNAEHFKCSDLITCLINIENVIRFCGEISHFLHHWHLCSTFICIAMAVNSSCISTDSIPSTKWTRTLRQFNLIHSKWSRTKILHPVFTREKYSLSVRSKHSFASTEFSMEIFYY